MKFEKSKVDALTGKTEVHYTLKEGEQVFRIIASATGVRFDGASPDFWGQSGAELLAQTIGQAFTEYQKMRPKFATNMGGH